MFMNPMDSLPGYGEIIKQKCLLDTQADDRCGGDMIGAALDYMIGKGWKSLGLFPEEEEGHREGISILENFTFLDWAMRHLIEDMEWDVDELDKVMKEGIDAFKKRQEDKDD